MNGAAEEQLALDYLLKQGLKLVARNFRARGGELDLVLRNAQTLVIAEVRKRSHRGFGSGADSVDARKQQRIILAARQFLMQHSEFSSLPVRFDVVGLDEQNRIDWIPDAFDLADAF